MKAAILHAAHEPMTIEIVELDGPRPEEVRIRVAASGLCHSDFHRRRRSVLNRFAPGQER